VSYTALAVTGMIVAGLADVALFRTRLLARRAFWVSYAILFGFQVLVDGVLTCRGIVRYNPERILGWHLACAPVEDYLFGFALILQTLTWWVWWGRRAARGRGAAAPQLAGGVTGGAPARPGRPDVRR
jgi:lycopene cyclase domain-containing protein